METFFGGRNDDAGNSVPNCVNAEKLSGNPLEFRMSDARCGTEEDGTCLSIIDKTTPHGGM